MVKVMYPKECCVDLATENQHWHDDLARDPPYAQSVFEVARVHFDIVRSRDKQFQKLVYMGNYLGPLRMQLTSREVVVTNSMIFMVVALALVSEAFDELDDALMHLRGLSMMIKIRGGLAALASKRSLQIKCCRLVLCSPDVQADYMLSITRVDLALAMRTGEKPLLFSADSLTWKPYLADPAKAPAIPWKTLVEAPDIRLVNVWLDLREFIVSVNLAHQTKRNISPGLFQEVLISVQYRLHHLAYSSHDRQETLRLSMLALSASLLLGVHSLHSRPLHCVQLEAGLRESVQAFDQASSKAFLELKLWLVYLGRMSVLDLPEDQPWLAQNLRRTTRALGLTTWVEVRSVLKGLLWVDIFHDEAGERIFNSAKSSEVTSPG
jgi:hypothetical protein